ncbi:MurR/RpiR family transcriptional regulator [Orrella dioscoreae]|uniref:MurR/RpiR family transcriptional regulator n=1 Tax=Orrella dioscoreae TaxID=1851544 RepID=UPI000A7DA9F3|nr:MurR/RpiR family transcriptional regulator [Orrella dioscoreae]
MLSSQLNDRIRKNLENMSEGARAVAQFVLEKPEDVAMLPAARVAERLGISESTVSRFAVLLGYAGYPAFRRDLQSDIRRHLEPLQRLKFTAPDRERSGRPYSQLFHQDIEDILRTERGIPPASMDQAVDIVSNARTIYIIGLRTSLCLAHSLYFQLQQMLGNVVLLDALGGETLEPLRNIGLQDVLIGISFPRHARLTVAAMQYAHEAHAKLIAITDGPMSPTANLADVLFSVHTSVLSTATSLTSGLSLINAICSEVLIKNRKRAAKNLAEVERMFRYSQIHYHSS